MEDSKEYPVMRSTPRPQSQAQTNAVEFIKSWIQRCVVPEIRYQVDVLKGDKNLNVKVAMNVDSCPEAEKMEWHTIESAVRDWMSDEIEVDHNGYIFTFKLKMKDLVMFKLKCKQTTTADDF